jgi:hypothetical protein
MDHAVLVSVVQRLRRLPRDPKRILERQLPVAPEPVAQALALDEGHGEPELPGGGAGIVHGQDVRVLEAGREADLALKPLGPEGLGQVGVKHLEGDGAVVLQVGRKEDRGHPAAAEFAEEGVLASEAGFELRAQVGHGFSGMRSGEGDVGK